MRHCILERLEEILLKFEMRKFFLLEEAHSKLAQSVQREKSDMRIVVAAYLAKH